METIDIATAVKNIVKKNPGRVVELSVHLQLQQHAGQIGMTLVGSREWPVDYMNTIVESASKKFGWKI